MNGLVCPHGKPIQVVREYGLIFYCHADGEGCSYMNGVDTQALQVVEAFFTNGLDDADRLLFIVGRYAKMDSAFSGLLLRMRAKRVRNKLIDTVTELIEAQEKTKQRAEDMKRGIKKLGDVLAGGANTSPSWCRPAASKQTEDALEQIGKAVQAAVMSDARKADVERKVRALFASGLWLRDVKESD